MVLQERICRHIVTIRLNTCTVRAYCYYCHGCIHTFILSSSFFARLLASFHSLSVAMLGVTDCGGWEAYPVLSCAFFTYHIVYFCPQHKHVQILEILFFFSFLFQMSWPTLQSSHVPYSNKVLFPPGLGITALLHRHYSSRTNIAAKSTGHFYVMYIMFGCIDAYMWCSCFIYFTSLSVCFLSVFRGKLPSAVLTRQWGIETKWGCYFLRAVSKTSDWRVLTRGGWGFMSS